VSRARPARRGRQAGLSIIEILVGLVIGLLIVSGMSSMVVGSRQTSRLERNLQDMQSIGRAAVQVISSEVRKGGYRTNREQALTDVFPAAAAPFDTAGAVVVGLETDDGLQLRYQGSGDAWTTDCLGNAIGNEQAVWQTLWLQDGTLNCRARNLTLNTDQTLGLIPQIEAISIRYGVDDDGDGFADVYRAAADVADWSRVASVNVQLRVVSAEDGLTDTSQPYLDFDGAATTPDDRRVRRSYAAVIAIRNLLP
jgi:type IV pilus assembly protein PilW